MLLWSLIEKAVLVDGAGKNASLRHIAHHRALAEIAKTSSGMALISDWQ